MYLENILVFCFGYNYKVSSGNGKNTRQKSTYIKHKIIKLPGTSTSQRLQMFLLTTN
jgi:hypothetical protein